MAARTILLVFVAFLLSDPAHAERRVALVIGNAAYQHATELANPVNDATAMAKALQELGFEVVQGIDQKRQDMVDTLTEFSQRAVGADAVVVFYSGHGIQVDGKNYLIPVDAALSSKMSVDLNTVPLDTVINTLGSSGSVIRMVFLDACRDNPFTREVAKSLGTKGGGLERGLAKTEGGRDTVIAFATKTDDTASDGAMTNSPFTMAILNNIRTPDEDVRFFLGHVKEDVEKLTGGTQTPWVNQSLGSQKWAFNPGGDDIVRTIPIQTTTASSAPLVGHGSVEAGSVFQDCSDCPQMVVVPAGSYVMGSEAGDGDQKPSHSVTIPRVFAVGKYEVTQTEWEAVMGSNPSKFKELLKPVEQVGWDDAQEFIRRLNAKLGGITMASTSSAGPGPYRLLTESEWEYASRAGVKTEWPCGPTGNCLDGLAWHGGNSDDQTHPVGQKAPNSFGLYDMNGNVWEWVEDCWSDSHIGAPEDGSARDVDSCPKRVLRGGAWNYPQRLIRLALRYGNAADLRYEAYGFRVARVLSQ